MSQDAPLRFKVRCPHCQQVFVVSAPSAPAGKQVEEKPKEPVAPTPAPEPVPEPIPEEPMTPEEEDFREKIVDIILSRKFDLPMLPHVALKVIRLTGSADTSMQDLAKVILTDQTIATKIIQISNSPVYAGTVEIKNINQALVRLGQTEIKNLMLAISLQTKIFKSKLYGRLAKQLWERSVGVAFASRVVASMVGYDKEEAFLCGLMHNLGKMITVSIIENAQRKLTSEFKATQKLVEGVLEQYHTDVGELTVEKWTLPKSVGYTLRYYHRLNDLEESSKLAPTVALSEVFCRAAGFGGEAEEGLDLGNHQAARMLQLDSEKCMELYDRFLHIFENAKGEFI